jgi:hypothetical protein
MIQSNIDNQVPLPSGVAFHDYCRTNRIYAEKLLDRIFDPHVSLVHTIDKYLSTIKSYITGERSSFDDFCRQSSCSID